MRWRVRSSHPAPRSPQRRGHVWLAAAKFIAEVAGVGRFKSQHAFARHNGKEAIRALERRLSDVVYRAMVADLDHATSLATVTYGPAAA